MPRPTAPITPCSRSSINAGSASRIALAPWLYRSCTRAEPAQAGAEAAANAVGAVVEDPAQVVGHREAASGQVRAGWRRVGHQQPAHLGGQHVLLTWQI